MENGDDFDDDDSSPTKVTGHICHFSPPLTSASKSPALHHMPSCCKLRRFGGVGVGVCSDTIP